MRTYAMTMPLAVLATALLLGCEDPGSNPLGPGTVNPLFDHSKGHKGEKGGGDGGGGGGDSRSVTVTLGGAMVTAAPQPPAKIQKDNSKEFSLDSDGLIEIDLNFAATMAAELDPNTSDADKCVVTEGTEGLVAAELLARMGDDFQFRNLHLHVDKTALGFPSQGHWVRVDWVDDDGGSELNGPGIGAGLGLWPTVEVVQNDGSTTYTFTGGIAGIRDQTGKPSENVTLRCPNLDTIVVKVVR